MPNPLWSRPASALLFAAMAGMVWPAEAELSAQPEREVSTLAGAYLAGRFAGSARDMSAAADYYADALAKDPDSPHLLERTFLLALASGNIERALDHAERLIELDASHRIAQLALGVEALRSGQYDTARRTLLQGGEGPVADLTATLLAAWALHGAGNTDNALELIDGLQGPDWYRLFGDYHAGLIAELDGRSEEAGMRYARAFELDSSALRIANARIRHEARHGSPERAKELLDGLDGAAAHPLLTELSADLDTGREPAAAAGSVVSGGAEVLFGIGAAMGREGGEDVAAVYLELALHLEPEESLALFSLGDLYTSLEQFEAALERYDAIPPESLLRRAAQIQAALALDRMDETDQAIERLELLIESDFTNFEAITALGNVLRGRERFEESAAAYSRALDQIEEPEARYWTLYYFRGIAYERSQQWDLAEQDLTVALELSPDQPLILNYLGYSWVDQGENLDEALEMIRRAVDLRPDDGYIVDSLGWAYYRLERYEEAVTELERAVELRPQDPIINDHLGDAYWMVGRQLEARFQWSHALDLDPEEDEIEKIADKLKNGLRGDEPSAADVR